MAYSQASNRAVQKYNKKAYDSIIVRVKKGEKEKIKIHAKNNNLSLNAYINKLIVKDMESGQ